VERVKLGLNIDTQKAHCIREKTPGLAAVSVRRIAREPGISLRNVSLGRRGLVVPHPMHNHAPALLIGGGEGVEA